MCQSVLTIILQVVTFEIVTPASRRFAKLMKYSIIHYIHYPDHAISFTVRLRKRIDICMHTFFAQMSVGQRIEMTVQPEYAYGMNGYPPIVPANAVLIYDIELLSFAAP